MIKCMIHRDEHSPQLRHTSGVLSFLYIRSGRILLEISERLKHSHQPSSKPETNRQQKCPRRQNVLARKVVGS